MSFLDKIDDFIESVAEKAGTVAKQMSKEEVKDLREDVEELGTALKKAGSGGFEKTKNAISRVGTASGGAANNIYQGASRLLSRKESTTESGDINK